MKGGVAVARRVGTGLRVTVGERVGEEVGSGEEADVDVDVGDGEGESEGEGG